MAPEDRAPWEDGGADAGGQVSVPGFASGGRVERTGIALVHEGEFIMPAPGSEALIAPSGAGAGGETVVNYYFPVEIEIVGTLGDSHLRQIADQIFEQLDIALRQAG